VTRRITPASGLSAALLVALLGACATPEEQHAPPMPPGPDQGALVEPDRAPAAYKIAPHDSAIGGTATYIIRDKDTLLDVARDYDLGYTQLITANRGMDPWVPPVGKTVTLPARYLLPDGPRKGIVINLVQHRLYYFPDENTVETYPIGVGVEDHNTPLGMTRITRKEVHPVWHVPVSIRKEDPDLPANVPPGPDNPLGDYAMQMGGSSFLIHGTNKPYGVGRNVSHGCVHLYPEDIEKLYPRIKVGTQVRIIDQEVMTGWIDGALYIAVYPNKTQAEALDVSMPVKDELPAHLKQQVEKAAAGHKVQINWREVEKAGRERSGIPVRVSIGAEMAQLAPVKAATLSR
jgi:L,D-transpeptidase ErfK/SrfK